MKALQVQIYFSQAPPKKMQIKAQKNLISTYASEN